MITPEVKSRALADVGDAFAHFVNEARNFAFMVNGDWPRDDDFTFAHEEIAGEGDDVRQEVDKKYAAQPDVVIDEADHGAGDEPSALEACEDEAVGVSEAGFRREFLDEGVHGGPEHPEAGGDQHAHEVDLPERGFAEQGEHGDGQHDEAAGGVEEHDEMAAVLAVNDYAAEGKKQHGRDGLKHEHEAERGFRVCPLEHKPGDAGGVQATANHRDKVGGENQA